MTPDVTDFLTEPAPATGPATDIPATEVQNCLAAAIDYCHQNLPPMLVDLIEGKWGLQPDSIEAAKIGYSGADNEIVDHLQSIGYNPTTILQTGIVTENTIRHVFECSPDDCGHSVPSVLDELARARARGDVEPAQIDLDTVVAYLDDQDSLHLRHWWENRITFPYRDENGTFRYLIGRKTNQSNDSPGKYVKLSTRKPWIDTDAIYEPLFGSHTVVEDKPLVITEGVTDALVAQQYGIRTISPVTTQVKHDQLSEIIRYAEQASSVFIVNDTEPSDAGLKGALRTGIDLYANDIPVWIGELPVEATGVDEIDLADYLSTHGPTAFRAVLEDAVPVDAHPRLDDLLDTDLPTAVTPSSNDRPAQPDVGALRSETGSGDTQSVDPVAVSSGHVPCEGAVPIEVDDEAKVSEYGSAIYELTLGDVCQLEPGYRGDNPIDHVGDSHSNYFTVFRAFDTDAGETKLRAYDHKTRHGYNALTWLACLSGARSTSAPGGKLTNRETWTVWKYAKENRHIATADPVPARAIWYIAAKHDLCEPEEIPQSHDDTNLPRESYNQALEIIATTYDLDPGREELPGI